MKKRLFGFLILLSLVFTVSAQSKEVQKLDEFGNTNCDDYLARMDYLLSEINNSTNSKGYIFVYEGKLKEFTYHKNNRNQGTRYISSEVGSGKELIRYLKNQLSFRRFPTEKVIFVEAGFREKFTIEFWLVPDDVDAPKPSPTLKKIKQRKQTRKPNGFCGDM